MASPTPTLWDRRRDVRFSSDADFTNPDPMALARPLVLVAENEAWVRRISVEAITALGYGVIQTRPEGSERRGATCGVGAPR